MIGVDPHKRSNTELVLDRQEIVLATQRFPNDREGHRALKKFARTWKARTWAVEGAHGCGLGLAQRLAAEGERVVNVPAKLSARVRALGGGSGRKTDDTDAYAVAVAGLRGRNLEVVQPDVVFRALLDDLAEREAASPAGHSGATLKSSASDPTPMVSPSDKSLTGLATTNATPGRQRSRVPA
jgi:hypothetical protein